MKLARFLGALSENAREILISEPTSVDECCERMVALLGNQWMNGIEPVASEMDRLMKHCQNRKDPILSELNMVTREMFVMTIHQLAKERERQRVRRKEG